MKAALVLKAANVDYHMGTAACTDTFPGLDVKTEEAIDEAVSVIHT